MFNYICFKYLENSILYFNKQEQFLYVKKKNNKFIFWNNILNINLLTFEFRISKLFFKYKKKNEKWNSLLCLFIKYILYLLIKNLIFLKNINFFIFKKFKYILLNYILNYTFEFFYYIYLYSSIRFYKKKFCIQSLNKIKNINNLFINNIIIQLYKLLTISNLIFNFYILNPIFETYDYEIKFIIDCDKKININIYIHKILLSYIGIAII